MKRVISLFFAVLLVLSLCSCSQEGSGENGRGVTINVYNWGEYIDQSVLDTFYEETGIKVNYTTYASNEEMYTKIISGAASYDVVIPSDYMIAKMISEGLLAELDFANIPNYSLIGDDYKGLAYDPDEKFSVPYTWGTVVIVYNPEYVDEEDVESCSMDLIFKEEYMEKYKGKILMFDNPRDTFALANNYLGHSLNTTNPDHWNDAADLLIAQKPYVQAYVMDQVFDKMISGEAYIAPYYAGDALTMMDENEDLCAFVPVEGANLFFDSMCVLATSTHKKEAEQFIDFMCRTDIAVANALEVCYAIPQTEAKLELPEEMQEDDMVYPDEDVLSRCEVFIDLPSDTLELQSNLWKKLKTAY